MHSDLYRDSVSQLADEAFDLALRGVGHPSANASIEAYITTLSQDILSRALDQMVIHIATFRARAELVDKARKETIAKLAILEDQCRHAFDDVGIAEDHIIATDQSHPLYRAEDDRDV